MPKIIDHDEKKQEILTIAYENIQKQGKQGTSVRSIASNANMTPGQIRYYFPNQTQLLQEVLNMLSKHIEEKIFSLLSNNALPIQERIVQSILLTMPLDEQRRADLIVWLAVQESNAQSNEHPMTDDIYRLVAASFEQLDHHNMIKKSIDKEKAITKLHALIDGLALHKLYNESIDNKLIETIIAEEIQFWME
ncbi:TetR/AcrR family transcriptional regulator [Macrococcus equi]|uniref:TetR/AcrR family transcriptional regulator n=1 Tax=Macrococcus equi TaxID=3395462 RepID=UPI0039BE6583